MVVGEVRGTIFARVKLAGMVQILICLTKLLQFGAFLTGGPKSYG